MGRKVAALKYAIIETFLVLFRDENIINLKQFDDGENPDLFRCTVAWIATSQFLFNLFLWARQGQLSPLHSIADVLVDHPNPGEEVRCLTWGTRVANLD